MDEHKDNFPVNISFVVERNQKTGLPFIAEKMTFEDLVSFLYMDLYRGMAVGNVPRLCHNCDRWFLLTGAYDTVYCQRIALGEETRTCPQAVSSRAAPIVSNVILVFIFILLRCAKNGQSFL